MITKKNMQVEEEIPSGIEFETLAPLIPPPVEKPEDRHLHTQFRRLYGCIEPAASRLQDSSMYKERATRRVAILVSLIPRNPSLPLGVKGLCVMLILVNKNLTLSCLVLFPGHSSLVRE